jgi:regulator of replication initiation timing
MPETEYDPPRSSLSLHFASLTRAFSMFQDLVKSHLMFAVREEVEVLKEKIAELMEKINQLEVENSILRANASQETLAQLNAPPPAASPPAGPVS